MNQISQHKILVTGDSFSHCSKQVHSFFDQTTLVIYDCIEVIEEHSSSSLDADFLQHISKAENRNHKLVKKLIGELTASGLHQLADLGKVEQGYQSKTLHILSHLLDGFLGIDSYFYSMIDDSHWLTKGTREAIEKDAAKFWLIHLDCFAATAEEASLLHT